jgi:hypothetical protein
MNDDGGGREPDTLASAQEFGNRGHHRLLLVLTQCGEDGQG